MPILKIYFLVKYKLPGSIVNNFINWIILIFIKNKNKEDDLNFIN